MNTQTHNPNEPMRRFFIFLSTTLLLSPFSLAAERYTYQDLADRLVNLERLAVLPSEGETAGQWSSYDRSSRYDPESGRYVNWDANQDTRGYIRLEDGQKVLAEMNGPGVIWRIWNTMAVEGSMGVYLDGSEKPVFTSSRRDLYEMMRESGGYSNLIYRGGRSMNYYIPIPYQESCLVVADTTWDAEYVIGYSTFPEGTELPAFDGEFGPEVSDALERVNRRLGNWRNPGPDRTGVVTDTVQVTIKPGETSTLFRHEGTHAITGIEVHPEMGEVRPLATLDREGYVRKPLRSMRVFPANPQEEHAFRELTIAMYWDGEKSPSVWAPLGDFFGSAPGWNTYRSIPMGMVRDFFYSHWYMPFRDGAEITLSNDGSQERTLTFAISHAPVQRPIGSLGRFHAKWHRDAFLPEAPGRKGVDWTLFTGEGLGRYCGTMLHVSNPKGGWWGSGDEKVFVDGEKRPSMFGTGTDSYFGMWINRFPSSQPFNAHTVTERSMLPRDNQSFARWHIPDAIPYRESLEIALGKAFPNDRPTRYAAVNYWYEAPGQSGGYQPIPLKERINYLPEKGRFGLTNTLEGEAMEVLGTTGGTAEPLHVAGLQTGGWSGMIDKAHLWWTGAVPGDTLHIAFPVQSTGQYKLHAQFIQGNEYGHFDLLLDGSPLGTRLQLTHDGVIPSGPEDLGLHHLEAGTHTLSAVVRESETTSHQFGLDYLWVEAWDGSRDPEPKSWHVTAGEFEWIYSDRGGSEQRGSINDHCYLPGPDNLWHVYGIGWPGLEHGTSPRLTASP